MVKLDLKKRFTSVLAAILLAAGVVTVASAAPAAADAESSCVPTASYPQADGTAYASISCFNGYSIVVHIYAYITEDGNEVASNNLNCHNASGSANVTYCNLPLNYNTGGSSSYASHEWCTVAYFYGISISSQDEEKDCIHVPGQGQTYYSTGWH